MPSLALEARHANRWHSATRRGGMGDESTGFPEVTPMPIAVRCPSCGKDAQAPDDAAGRSARCKCGSRFQVPDAVPGPVALPDLDLSERPKPIAAAKYNAVADSIAARARRHWIPIASALGLLAAGFGIGRWTAPKIAVVRFENVFGTNSTVEIPVPDKPTKPAPSEPDPPKQAPVTPIGKTIQRGDIEVSIASTEIGTLADDPQYPFWRGPKGPVLIVKYTYKNISKNKRYFLTDYISKIEDDAGNHYKEYDVPAKHPTARGSSHERGDVIGPGESAGATVAFEPPMATSKELILAIPGNEASQHEGRSLWDKSEDFRFSIPVKAIGQIASQ